MASVVRLGPLLLLNELLDEIGNDQPTSAIEMDAVRVEAPAIDLGDFVRALAQHQSAEGITIEGKKPKLCESATG
jgi:hypothetical protein